MFAKSDTRREPRPAARGTNRRRKNVGLSVARVEPRQAGPFLAGVMRFEDALVFGIPLGRKFSPRFLIQPQSRLAISCSASEAGEAVDWGVTGASTVTRSRLVLMDRDRCGPARRFKRRIVGAAPACCTDDNVPPFDVFEQALVIGAKSGHVLKATPVTMASKRLDRRAQQVGGRKKRHRNPSGVRRRALVAAPPIADGARQRPNIGAHQL